MPAGLNYPSSAPPVAGEVVQLTTAPDGGYSLVQHAKAAYYNGYTYFNWIDGGTGALQLRSYKHSDDSLSTVIQVDGMGSASNIDDHENAGMLIRSTDHKLLVFFCLHNGANMFVSISNNSLTTDPTISGGFATAVNLDSAIGASDYTYPEAYEVGSNIYLFYRDQSSSTGRLAYSKVATASAGTAGSWAARTVLMTGASTVRPYWAIRSTSSRIDIMSTDRAPAGDEGLVDLGHMYLDGATDNVYKSDGTQITATKPFAHSELTQLETNTNGQLAVDGVAGTNPIFTYIKDNGDGTAAYVYARWSGAAWVKTTVVTDDYHPGDKFFAGMAINQASVGEVYLSRKETASSSEIWKYVTADSGATFGAGTQITTGSGDYNWGVMSVQDGVASLPAIWARGTWTSDSVFNLGLRGFKV
jgi:hypothetical protein